MNVGDHFPAIAAMYAKSLIAGNNLTGIIMRAESLKGYLQAVNELFEAKQCPPPVNFANPKIKGSAAQFYHQVQTWEEEPNRRTHMTPEFLHELISQADATQDKDSFVPVMVDWTIMARYAGFRMCEVGQRTQTRIEYHIVPVTGRRIMKAFRRGDFQFFDAHGFRITDVLNNASLIRQLKILWRVQKNRRNGQWITWWIDTVNPRLCMVAAAIRIYLRSLYHDPKGEHPLGFYTEKGRVKYITGRKFNLYLKDVAQKIYPDITPKELSQFSAHMWRVTACVLLQQAGKDSDYIKKRLRWAGESYKIYLRDTSVLARQHLAAVSPQVGHFTDAYRLEPLALPANPLENQEPVDVNAGQYEAF